MEPFWDEQEEQEYERRRLQHAIRIQHMREEKIRQQKRRRLMKKCLPAALLAVIVLVVGVNAFAEKRGGDNQAQVGTEQFAEANEIENNDKKQEIQENTVGLEQNADGQAEDITEKNMQTEDISEKRTVSSEQGTENETDVVEATEAEPVIAEMEEQPIAYEFVETADTLGIYSEEIISANAILIDESTDTIIASKGVKERICPASMTKVLTVLVAAEHITEEDLDDTFQMTLEITDYAYVNDCSSVGFLDEEIVTVRDLFYGTVLPSGGDAAVGLATYIAGSHEAFVEMMNEKLDELGLADTAHFTNCVGLYDDDHYCTVYDMAVIMKAAMQNELCREFLSAHTYTTVPTEQHPEGITISNWFLRRIEDKDTGGEVLCAKTGYVAQSGSCAVSYGTFAGGTPYICVTAGSSSSWRCIYDHVEIYTRYVPGADVAEST